jgi:AP2 domain/HNH endonuclease
MEVTIKGRTAFIDEQDAHIIESHKWCVCQYGDKNYILSPRLNSEGRSSGTFLLHRLIMSAKKGEYIDHVNGDGLDNRRANLRFCSKSQNGSNRGRQNNNKSGFKGVSWSDANKKWIAQITSNGIRCHLGTFSDPLEAHKAYCEAAKRLHGDFANLGT